MNPPFGFSIGASPRTVGLIAVSTGQRVGLTMNGPVYAASADTVVPPHGKVAGQGYGFYGGKSWQLILKSPAHHQDLCGTATVGGQQVAMISSKAVTKGSGSYHQTCTDRPDGRSISSTSPMNARRSKVIMRASAPAAHS